MPSRRGGQCHCSRGVEKPSAPNQAADNEMGPRRDTTARHYNVARRKRPNPRRARPICRRAYSLVFGKLTPKNGLLAWPTTRLPRMLVGIANLLAEELGELGAIHFVFMDWRHIRELLVAGSAVYSELKNVVVWVKSNAGQGSFYRSQHELIFVYKNGDAPPHQQFRARATRP
jgi:hypothetical protein